MSTHSSIFCEDLPFNAVKLLSFDNKKNSISMHDSYSLSESNQILGSPEHHKIYIYVEDKEAKALLDCIIEQLNIKII
jgi:hypothetical protein